MYTATNYFQTLYSAERNNTGVFVNGSILKSAKESAMLYKNKNLKFCIVLAIKWNPKLTHYVHIDQTQNLF
jgi:hypothetical protein